MHQDVQQMREVVQHCQCALQEDSVSMKSQGCSGENNAGMLNITSQQDCTQDSSSVVASRKMAVGESLKQLGMRRKGKGAAKTQPTGTGSQPNIMSFFRRDTDGST